MPFPNIDHPIPGENFTSDTKNYPWHRPPEFDNLDAAIEASAKQLMSKSGSLGILTLLKKKVDVATLTDMFVTSGIGAGKWTPDFALLLAGPVSHMIYLMGAGYGMKPKLGIDNEFHGPTSAVADMIMSGPMIAPQEAQAGPVAQGPQAMKDAEMSGSTAPQGASPAPQMASPAAPQPQPAAPMSPAAQQIPNTGFMGGPK